MLEITGLSVAVAMADLDADGLMDVVFGNVGSKIDAVDVTSNAGSNTYQGANEIYFGARKLSFTDVSTTALADSFSAIEASNANKAVRNSDETDRGWCSTISWDLTVSSLYKCHVAGESGFRSYGRSMAGDVDGDGDLDLFIDSALFKNDGSGRFAVMAPGHTPYLRSAPVALTDVDADGDLDAIGEDMVVHYNIDGLGTFIPHTTEVTIIEGEPPPQGNRLVEPAYRVPLMGSKYIPGGAFFQTHAEVRNAFAALQGDYIFGDINGDGLADVLMNGAGVVKLYVNNGTGVFEEEAQDAFNPGGRPTSIVDINGDGLGDLILIYRKSQGGDSTLQQSMKAILNSGVSPGRFMNANEIQLLDLSSGLTAANDDMAYPDSGPPKFADLNGDGHLDMVFAIDPHPIFLGDGANPPTFTPLPNAFSCNPIFATTTTPGHCEYALVHLGDIDGDGFIDVMLARNNQKFEVHLNNGYGYFASIGTTTSLTALPKTIEKPTYEQVTLGDNVKDLWDFATLADIDNDGDLDVIINLGRGNIQVYAADFCLGGAMGPSGACYTCPAFAARGAIANTCTECAAHYARGTTTCEACPSGSDRQLSGASQYQCNECAPGSSSPGDGNPCELCPRGTIAATSGSVKCTPCPPGTATNLTGGTICPDCPAGTYCEEGWALPRPCAAGRYGDRTNQISQDCVGPAARGHFAPEGSISDTARTCPAGTYNDKLGIGSAGGCTPCPNNYICPAASTTPVPCGDNLVTAGTGASLFEECECSTNYYRKSVGNNTFTCVLCDATKIDCSDIGGDIGKLKVKAGYWRSSNTSDAKSVQPCFNTLACAGAQVTNVTTAPSGRRLSAASGQVISESTYGDGLCVEGHTGPYCAVCKDGYIGGDDKNVCTECGGDLIYTILVGVVIVALLATGVIVFCRAEGASVKRMQELAETRGKMSRLLNTSAAKTASGIGKAKEDDKIESVREKTRRRAKKAVGASLAVAIFVNSTITAYKVKMKILISLFQVRSRTCLLSH